MPQYAYTAKDGPGRTVTGTVSAVSRAEAVSRIDTLGYTPVSVTEAAETRPDGRPARGGRVSRADVTVFTRQFASLVRAGVPILRGLRTIAEQSENPATAAMVAEIEAGIRDGQTLSELLSKHPRQFSSLYVNMVRAGETGGVLDVTLERLADARERDDELRRRVQAALAYPTLVLLAGGATVFVLLAFFLPRMAALFEGYNGLPAPTRIMMGISRWFSSAWPWLAGAVAVLAAAFARISSSAKGRLLLDRALLSLPLVGAIARDSEIARFARTLALMLNSGIPIEAALRLCEGVVRNTVLCGGIGRARERTVGQGASFSAGLRSSGVFPPFVSNMAAVGEESGRLDAALGEVAAYYEKSVEQRTRLATSLLEPVLILFVGGIVGFIVAAMLLPIFEIGNVLR
jgi:type II secretory pathway component PulF